MKRIATITLAMLAAAPHLCAAQPRAVDLEMADVEAGVYVLYEDGVVLTAGTAVMRGQAEGADAVDFTLTPTGEGYYILERDGTLHSFGDAVRFGQPVSSREDVVDMELHLDGGFYFLREDGTVLTVGSAIYRGHAERDGAADLELSPDGEGYTVLYEDGFMAFFGSAVNYGSNTSSRVNSVDLEVLPEGYYILQEDGNVQTYGEAVPYPSQSLPADSLTAMALTPRGYRTLDEKGEVRSVLSLESQGRISWFAQSVPRPVEPRQTATPTPRPTPTPMPGTAYFNFSVNGYTEQIAARLPADSQLPEGVNTGQASFSSGQAYLATAGANGAARSIHRFLPDDFGDEYTGEAFAELSAGRGAAAIRGLSASPLGLLATVEEGESTLLILIRGDFGDNAAVGGFLRHE